MDNIDLQKEYADDQKSMLIFFIVGLLIVGFGYFLAYRHDDFQKHAISTSGTISACSLLVKNAPHTRGTLSRSLMLKHADDLFLVTYGSECYRYRIDFQTNDKQIHNFFVPADIDGHKIGDKIKILYLQNQPENSAIIDRKYFHAALLKGIGAVTIAFSLLGWLLYRYRLI